MFRISISGTTEFEQHSFEDAIEKKKYVAVQNIKRGHCNRDFNVYTIYKSEDEASFAQLSFDTLEQTLHTTHDHNDVPLPCIIVFSYKNYQFWYKNTIAAYISFIKNDLNEEDCAVDEIFSSIRFEIEHPRHRLESGSYVTPNAMWMNLTDNISVIRMSSCCTHQQIAEVLEFLKK